MGFDGTRVSKFTDDGTTSVSLSSASTGTVAITFLREFATPPRILAMADQQRMKVNLVSKTTTGAVLRVADIDGTPQTMTVGIDWIARGDI